jgi:hypothetical protein
VDLREIRPGLLSALDREVERLERPVSVLLTAPWHARDAASVAQRYGTVVWPIDNILVSRGGPVIGEGKRRIDEALREFETPV